MSEEIVYNGITEKNPVEVTPETNDSGCRVGVSDLTVESTIESVGIPKNILPKDRCSSENVSTESCFCVTTSDDYSTSIGDELTANNALDYVEGKSDKGDVGSAAGELYDCFHADGLVSTIACNQFESKTSFLPLDMFHPSPGRNTDNSKSPDTWEEVNLNVDGSTSSECFTSEQSFLEKGDIRNVQKLLSGLGDELEALSSDEFLDRVNHISNTVLAETSKSRCDINLKKSISFSSLEELNNHDAAMSGTECKNLENLAICDIDDLSSTFKSSNSTKSSLLLNALLRVMWL